MTGYYGLRGEPFIELNGPTYRPFILRITAVEQRITSIWAVDAKTLTPFKDLIAGWRDAAIPDVWKVCHSVSSDLELDEGL